MLIAIELTLGAVVGGPFDVSERDLTAKIQRIMAAHQAGAQTIH